MCQRAFGAFYAPLVIAHGLEWTSGTRQLYVSSNLSQRGFCGDCGTPLSLENIDDDLIEVSTASLDNPELAPPTVQINHRYGWTFTDGIGELPDPDADTIAENDAWNMRVISHQSD